jgi:SsrA-binding protein
VAKKAVKGPKDPSNFVVATNRQARRDYDIVDTLECGIVLRGSEVKSLREAKVQLADAHARIITSELWLLGLHIAPYSFAHGADGHATERDRKLLAHREQIARLRARLETERLTLIPLSLYFREGRAKVEIAVARGRKQHDKRQAIATRDADREVARTLAAARRGEG